MFRLLARRALLSIFLVCALFTGAGQAASQRPSIGQVQAFAIQVPDLGRLVLVGKDPASAISGYIEGLIHDKIFPGQEAVLRRWGRTLLATSADAPTVASLRAITGQPLSGIQLNHLDDLVGSAEHKATRRLFAQGMQPAGMQSVYLPPAVTGRQSGPTLAELSHLMLTGGDDTHPKLNDEAITHAHVDELNLLRDLREAALVRKAAALGMPIDSVCRGYQLINRIWGGNLAQDIHLDGLTVIPHSAPGFEPTPMAVKVAPGSALWSASGRGGIIRRALFMHHQALDRIAAGFRVTGRTADGIAAAIEGFGGQIRGTQFHFERSLESSHSKAIFAAMGSRARAYETAHVRR